MAGYSSCSTVTVPSHGGMLGDSQNSCLNLGHTTPGEESNEMELCWPDLGSWAGFLLM